MNETIQWLEKAKQTDYEIYKKDPKEYYAQLEACSVWLQKHFAAVHRLAHHVWEEHPHPTA